MGRVLIWGGTGDVRRAVLAFVKTGQIISADGGCSMLRGEG